MARRRLEKAQAQFDKGYWRSAAGLLREEANLAAANSDHEALAAIETMSVAMREGLDASNAAAFKAELGQAPEEPIRRGPATAQALQVHTPHEPPESFTATGRNGQLTVTPDKIIISRKGAMGFLTQGHKGDKEIQLSQISAVQFKRSGPLTVGYIQFSFLGGSETKRGIKDAVSDENSILFNATRQPDFVRAKELLDLYLGRLRGVPREIPRAEASSLASLDELERLAELRDKGIITADDFEKKKIQILGL